MPIVRFAILALFIAGLAGCATEPPPRPAPGSMTKAPYSEAFVAGRYSEAYQQAVETINETEPGRQRDEAALVAGLSASQIDRSEDARRWLEPLTRSSERDIAGRAGAGLGLMNQERGRHVEAAALLKEASEKLTGDEAARAAYQAGQSYEALGMRDQARVQYALAANQATDPALKSRAQQRGQSSAVAPVPVGKTGGAGGGASGSGGASGGGASASGGGGAYALQLGVFAKLQNAEECVRKNSPIATRLGLGLPRVEQRVDDGRTVYAVRIGRFATKDEASGRKRSFPGSAVVENKR